MLTGKSNDLLKSRFKVGRCELCGKTGERLEFHHIRYRPEIGMSLCHLCHFKIHYRRTTLRDCELAKILCRICKPETINKWKGNLKLLLDNMIRPSSSLSLSLSLQENKYQEQKEDDKNKMGLEIAPSRKDFLLAAELLKRKESKA